MMWLSAVRSKNKSHPTGEKSRVFFTGYNHPMASILRKTWTYEPGEKPDMKRKSAHRLVGIA